MVKRTVLILDYDGCASVAVDSILKKELEKPFYKAQPTDTPDEIKRKEKSCVALRTAVAEFKAYIKEVTKNSSAVSVYVGSDRQSKAMDAHNARANDNGSVFPAMKELCASISTKERPATFEPYLLPDRKDHRGETLRNIEKDGKTFLPITHADAKKGDLIVKTEFILPTGVKAAVEANSKVELIKSIIKDAETAYPDDELEFMFVDDRELLATNVIENITESDFGTNTKSFSVAKFSFAQFVYEATKDPSSKYEFGILGKDISGKDVYIDNKSQQMSSLCLVGCVEKLVQELVGEVVTPQQKPVEELTEEKERQILADLFKQLTQKKETSQEAHTPMEGSQPTEDKKPDPPSHGI